VDVEDAIDSRHDLNRTDAFLPLLENPRRQTGSVGKRPSGDAILDPNVVAIGHRGILSKPSLSLDSLRSAELGSLRLARRSQPGWGAESR
jgi:hypothetical protein